MSGDWRIDVAIALIGAIGLIVPGWLAYKGNNVGKDEKPSTEAHGTLAWEHSKTRDFIAREHDETRRQIREACTTMEGQHAETRRQLRDEVHHITQTIRSES